MDEEDFALWTWRSEFIDADGAILVTIVDECGLCASMWLVV